MKKVTIPTCANPFVVIVNGIKYTYPAGETVEVPDEVASAIEQHNEAHNNPEPAPVVPPFVPSEVGGGLPVVDIKSTISLEDLRPVQLSTEENAALDLAAASGLPAVIKFVLDGPYSAVFFLYMDGGAPTYMFSYGAFDFILNRVPVDNTWYFSIGSQG